jgi:hypothetical protein
LTLEDEIDLSRGDMLFSSANPPHVSQRFLATIVWMHAQSLELGHTYLIKHCARQVRGKVVAIQHRVNIGALQPENAQRLEMNDIATVEFETNSPLFFDAYQQNRTTGSFIVIDPLTNATLAAGMIREDLSQTDAILPGKGTPASQRAITPFERHQRHGHRPAIILVNARASLASQLERSLFEGGFQAMTIEENSFFSSSRNTWAALHAAGFVVIYNNPSLGTEERLQLRNVGDHFFDLSELELPAGDAEAVERMLALVQSLRIPIRATNPGKAN